MSGLTAQDRAKRAVGIAAVERYVKPGMLLGLGSGTTSHWFVRALGAAVAGGLEVRGVPTSTSTRELAESLRIPLAGFDEIDRLELIVDGPDEVDRDGHMIKGGGACLLWERIVADAADYYVVVADVSKLKDRLGAFPLPIEVVQHGWESTTRSIGRLLAVHGYPADVPLVRRVDAAGVPVVTDSGNFLVDAHLGAIARSARDRPRVELDPRRGRERALHRPRRRGDLRRPGGRDHRHALRGRARRPADDHRPRAPRLSDPALRPT